MSKEIIVPAINNLLDLNGWMIKWKPSKIARMLDIPVKMLYNARDSIWFHTDKCWTSYVYWYNTIDLKSRSIDDEP